MGAMCTCCRERRADGSLLRLHASSGARVRTTPLCGLCARWLAGLARDAARGATPGLIAAPQPHGALVFEDQCGLCRAVSWSETWSAEVVTGFPAGPSWRAATLCQPCATWLLALATDGRTAQGAAARRAEAEYGSWLQPRLPPLALSLAVGEPAAARLVREVVGRITVSEGEQPVPLLVREVPATGPIELPRARETVPRELWLVPARAVGRLPDLLHDGVADWRTLPLTPQQLVGGIELAVREWCARSSWVPALALRLVDLSAVQEPLVIFDLPRGAELESVWLLRRFPRGQDALGALPDGRVALLPRGGEAAAAAVAERLGTLLGLTARVERKPQAGPRLDLRC